MQSAVEPRFAVGALVRVRVGVMDPDLSGVHLGGWKGTISQIQHGGLANYLVQWTPETLEGLKPVHREHCAREDLAIDKIWLLEEDLEPVHGASSPLTRKNGVPSVSLPC